MITVESSNLQAEFSDAGALVSVRSLADGWDLVRRSELGRSFRLLVPLEDRRNNSVEGSEQDAPTVTHDEQSVSFEWVGVRSQHGGRHDISVRQTYSFDEGHLIVATSVDNRSDAIVENVFSPYLGDLRPREDSGTLRSIRHDYGSGMSQPMWPRFENSVGYYGVDVPTQLAQQWMPGYAAPVVPYTLLQGDGHGAYIGVDTMSTELVAWHAELWPGYEDSLESDVAIADEIAGTPSRIQFAAVHLPYLQPGASVDLTPIRIGFYSGDWHDGADIYIAWRTKNLVPAVVPQWAHEPHSWHQVQINSPEDELRIHFSEFADIGRDAAAAGVKAIQLVGFNIGGQDRNNPRHDPDPRMGGADALRDAIAEVRALGVKVILFAKFNWADRSTPEFREKWVHEAVKDPYGDYYMHPGYKYETVTQILDINTRRLVPMCFLSETYLDECVAQFQLLVDLGADGILYDECLHHLPTLLCFDTSHGHRYGAPTYANDRELIRRFRLLVADRPDFLFAGEAIYDWEFDAYALSYHRSEKRDHLPLHRYTAARQQMMTAATGFDDRNMINQCLLYRYVISYEPYNFKGRLTDFPATVAYGQQMDGLREELREWVWDGLFRDTVGATVVTVSGQAHHPFTVFESATGERAVSVANYDRASVSVRITTADGDGPMRAKFVDGGEWVAIEDGLLELPPRSAAVVVAARL